MPETDLARIAPQGVDQKYARLTAFQKGRPDFNYTPLKRWTLTLLHGQDDAFASSTQSMEQIERGVRFLMGEKKGLDQNIAAARALRALADEMGIRVRSMRFHDLAWGAEGNYAFWLPLIADLKGRPCLLFLDPRLSSSRLDGLGRRFVYSAMNAHIREAGIDLDDAQMGIIQFSAIEDGDRKATLHLAEDEPLYSFEDLSSMVAETYRIWRIVREERAGKADPARKAG